ncbi:MAG: DoxX family protein [Bacteroidetes bacterium]|nr:DoxX family protein [Bacteroidota bacterium]
MIKLYNRVRNGLIKAQDLPLLFLRLILAYGFWEPARTKWADINAIAEWFEGMGIFAPKLNAYLAASTEMAGVFLLALGLGTRIICFPLIITMIVAIKTVHWENGFPAGDNGYEIPLYFMLMLITLLCFGPGKLSIDYLIRKRLDKK